MATSRLARERLKVAGQREAISSRTDRFVRYE